MKRPRDTLSLLRTSLQDRIEAEYIYPIEPLDADNLMKWGASLIVIAQFKYDREGKEMLIDAISKLEEALKIDPTKAEALRHLSNANNLLASLTSNVHEAKEYMDKAREQIQKAVDQEPDNELYCKSLEIIIENSKKTKRSSGLNKYGMFGLIILAIGVVAWVGMSKPPALQDKQDN